MPTKRSAHIVFDPNPRATQAGRVSPRPRWDAGLLWGFALQARRPPLGSLRSLGVTPYPSAAGPIQFSRSENQIP